MSIYDQNHNKISEQLLPPDKRSETMLAWERCLVKPIQWLHDLFFIDYAKGTQAFQFNILTIYAVGARVQYQHMVYEMWNASGVAGTLPTDTNSWILVLSDFRGANERVKFSSQIIVFEYLLNQWFDTTFRQPVWVAPPGTPNPRSDIWISNTSIVDGSFIIRPDGLGAAISFIRPNGFAISFIRPNHAFKSVNFIVHYPLSIIPDGSIELSQLKALVEQYHLGGTVAGYQPY